MGRLARLHDRYFLRWLVFWVGASFAVFSLVIAVGDVMGGIDDIAEHFEESSFVPAAWLTFGVYFVRTLSRVCELGYIIFVLGAGVHVVILARGNEFVGLLASGVSMKRLLAPALVLAAALGLAVAAFRECPLPELNRLGWQWMRHVRGRSRWKPGEVLVKAGSGGVLVVDEYDREARVARGFVWCEGGRFVVSDEATWDEKESSWVFPRKGKVFDYEGGEVGTRLDELRTPIGPEAFELAKLGPEALTLGELSRLGGTKARAAFHARLSDVLSWVILVALGLPVVVRLAGRSALTGAGLCVLLALGYELASRAGVTLASAGTLPTCLGAWGPKLAFGCLAAVTYSMLDRS